MPATQVIKPKPVGASRRTMKETKPVKVRAVKGAENELQVPAVRNGRASSCPRSPQHHGERSAGAQRTAPRRSCERRTRSSSTAPNWPRTTATNSGRHVQLNPKIDPREMSTCPSQREQRSVRHQSHKAFTVIPPDPKKRREIQRKAAAELAALEALRLSRAMSYVSINPSSVGGCMSLEEVRLKQQQDMMQAKRKQKPVKTQVMETPILES